jgi:hypothetical protein
LISFNEWGQQVTGWSSIRIYKWAETTHGQLLDDLRQQLEDKLQKQSQVDLGQEIEVIEAAPGEEKGSG